MNLQGIMTRDVQCIRPDDTVQEAAEVMRQADVGALPVCEWDGIVVGMLTDRDIVRRTTAKGLEPIGVKVRDVMTCDVVRLLESQDVLDAAQLMDIRQVRRLVVVQPDGRLVGIVSLDDLAHHPELRELAGTTLNRVSQSYEPNQRKPADS